MADTLFSLLESLAREKAHDAPVTVYHYISAYARLLSMKPDMVHQLLPDRKDWDDFSALQETVKDLGLDVNNMRQYSPLLLTAEPDPYDLDRAIEDTRQNSGGGTDYISAELLLRKLTSDNRFIRELFGTEATLDDVLKYQQAHKPAPEPFEQEEHTVPAPQPEHTSESRAAHFPEPVIPFDDRISSDGGAAPTLPGITDKLTEIREKLLSIVRGQRHAVEEITQGLFESEMFARNDKKRKGPVSTFLFMGPSGVGKTFLAKQYGELSGRPVLVVDMSEYSDNLANMKFNGEHGETPVVTGFVRQHPNAILIFDEIEKAHINTIYLFLQILDAGQLMDQKVHKEVSFRNTTVIMTTNVGAKLYDSVTTRDLSGLSRTALINALKSEKKADNNDVCVFPESITTRMANGHIVMFNHLEPYALLEIVRDEIRLQTDLFHTATGIDVSFDEVLLPALFMYAGGGASDARTLRGLARNAVIREIQDLALRLNTSGALNTLKSIRLTVDTAGAEEETAALFRQPTCMHAVVFSDQDALLQDFFPEEIVYSVTGDTADFQKKIRGVIDFAVLDPYAGFAPGARTPADVEDIHSIGMQMFDYLRDYYPEIPVYILDTKQHSNTGYSTLLARGARGIIPADGSEDAKLRLMQEFSLNAMVENSIYQLGRSGKFVSYNCAQYDLSAEDAEISFASLHIKKAVSGDDIGAVAQQGENSDVTFKDIIGCKTAKESLAEFAAMLDSPRENILKGRRMPKGVLLYGPPGTGKTMLAKAMANESRATFLPASATAFFGSLVGQTEENIRELFRKARRYAPSVIFIDEVDAIARKRTGGIGSTHNEDALTTFLSEMDGFVVDEKRPVFILAATNYEVDGDGPRVLDGAFVRRFDRRIRVDLPETDDRNELYLRSLLRHNISFGDAHESVVRSMAERSGGLSNADIEMIVEMYVRSLGDGEPDSAAFMDTLDEFRFGDLKEHEQDDLRQTAYHEAGHALVSWVCGVKPLFITISSRGNYGGYMETSTEGKGTFTYSELKDIVCRALAGRAAEVEFYGEKAGINTGASSDLEQARRVTRSCLQDYGMGEKLYNPYAGKAGEEMMQTQFARARAIIAENRPAMDALVEILMKEKCMDKEQIDALLSGMVTPL